jgi:hypothetical protein
MDPRPPGPKTLFRSLREPAAIVDQSLRVLGRRKMKEKSLKP